MLKFTLVVSGTFSCLIAAEIWVCFSAGGAEVAEVAALPVVVDFASLPGLALSAVVGELPVLLSAVAGFAAPESEAFDLSAAAGVAGLLSAVVGFAVPAAVPESEAFDLLSPVIPPDVLVSVVV